MALCRGRSRLMVSNGAKEVKYANNITPDLDKRRGSVLLYYKKRRRHALRAVSDKRTKGNEPPAPAHTGCIRGGGFLYLFGRCARIFRACSREKGVGSVEFTVVVRISREIHFARRIVFHGQRFVLTFLHGISLSHGRVNYSRRISRKK